MKWSTHNENFLLYIGNNTWLGKYDWHNNNHVRIIKLND